jgi:hypothetical protein
MASAVRIGACGPGNNEPGNNRLPPADDLRMQLIDDPDG